MRSSCVSIAAASSAVSLTNFMISFRFRKDDRWLTQYFTIKDRAPLSVLGVLEKMLFKASARSSLTLPLRRIESSASTTASLSFVTWYFSATT